MENSKNIISVHGLSKSFPGVKALDEVDFTLKRGEIYSLMGENGAGKSTVIKVLTGIYRKDAGEISYNGKPFEVGSTEEAQDQGISTVYQEVNLIPGLSVAENIYLGREPLRKGGSIIWKSVYGKAREAIKRLGLDIDVTQSVSSYPLAIQQLVAITRALDISAQVLILDEPTSSLDTAEVERLFAIMRQLKENGMTIVFVTHFLDQAFEITDHFIILRNGKSVGQYPAKEISRIDLISKMLGKEIAELDTRLKKDNPMDSGDDSFSEKDSFLKVEQMGRKGFMPPFDLSIKKGEVLGLAGLLGSGRTEIARLIFGATKSHSGNTQLNGKNVTIDSPKKAIGFQFGFCPEDRMKEGIIPTLSVRENLIFAIQAKRGFKLISRMEQEQIVEKYIKILDIKTSDMEQGINNLSGGNRQKVIIARWLATNPDFLILDEPTRGIDVGAKSAIQELVVKLSEEGMAIMFISSEIEEVVRCSDRILVLRDRKKVAELSGADIDENKIMQTIAAYEDAV